MAIENISLSQILNTSSSGLADTSEIKLDGKGSLYSDSNRPTGLFSTARRGISFLARFVTGATKTLDGAKEKIAAEIGTLFGKEAEAQFKESFSSRMNKGTPLTAENVRSFVAQNNIKTEFQKDATIGSTKQIQESFATHSASPSETVKIISAESATLGEMGYNTSEDMGLSDGLIPSGGAMMIYGKEDLAFMTDELQARFTGPSDEAKKSMSSTPDELALEKAGSLDWDSRIFTANGLKIDCSTNKNTHSAEQNLKNFKAAIKTLTGTEPSSRQAYELMCLIDRQNYMAGWPSGQDVKTGMAFNMSAMKDAQGKEGRDTIDINATNKTFSIDVASPRSYLSSIVIPKNDPKSPVKLLSLGAFGKGGDPKSLTGANAEQRKAILGDTRQFEVSAKCTCIYTPDPQGAPGKVAVAKSRQAYWPLTD